MGLTSMPRHSIARQFAARRRVQQAGSGHAARVLLFRNNPPQGNSRPQRKTPLKPRPPAQKTSWNMAAEEKRAKTGRREEAHQRRE